MAVAILTQITQILLQKLSWNKFYFAIVLPISLGLAKTLKVVTLRFMFLTSSMLKTRISFPSTTNQSKSFIGWRQSWGPHATDVQKMRVCKGSSRHGNSSLNQYYNLRYNPSAPFVCSRFLVSYRVRSAIKTTAPRTAPHLKYIQGIGIPNKASFEILAMNTGLNW